MMALITALRDTQEQNLDMGLSVNLDYSLCNLISLFYFNFVLFILFASVGGVFVSNICLLLLILLPWNFYLFIFIYPASDVHAVQWT